MPRKKPEGVYLADAEQSFAAGDPTPAIPGKELFYEHVHFTFDGNYALALAVLDQVEKALPRLAGLRKSDSALAKQQCKQALALTVG